MQAHFIIRQEMVKNNRKFLSAHLPGEYIDYNKNRNRNAMNYYVSGEALNGRPCRGIVHVIKKGDTLYKLSRVYDVRVADIIWQNPGARIYNLQIGDQLCIPVRTQTGMPGTGGINVPETFPYVVREGENLEQILSMFNMTWDELKVLNPDEFPSYAVGTVLNIPSDRILRQDQK